MTWSPGLSFSGKRSSGSAEPTRDEGKPAGCPSYRSIYPMISTPAARGRPGGRRLTWALAVLAVLAVGAGAFVLYSTAGANPGCETPRGASACTRVFFLGNSYTAVNDLPDTFAALA